MPQVLDIRLDKWLKVARFFKKRSEATEAVDNGSVKLNGERVKPAKTVKIGDELTIRKDTRYRKYTVKGVTNKSLSAVMAKELYKEIEPEGITPEMAETIRILEEQEKANRRRERGKPNKKQMRDLHRRKYGD
jgi:ribosome-associated heat shock protein Hsp15